MRVSVFLSKLFLLNTVALPLMAQNILPINGVKRISEYINGAEGGPSFYAMWTFAGCRGPKHSATDDGKIIAFETNASFDRTDTNGTSDIYVRDMSNPNPALHTLKRISLGYNGVQSVGDSNCPTISSDGRYVSFRTHGWNFWPGTTFKPTHVYLHDRVTGITSIIDKRSDGVVGDGQGDYVVMTPDARYAVFISRATNLVTSARTQPTNIAEQTIFRKDMVTNKIDLVTATPSRSLARGNNESETPSVSDDGRYIVFASYATNLVPASTYNATSGSGASISQSGGGSSGGSSGRVGSAPSEFSGTRVFLRDMQTRTTIQLPTPERTVYDTDPHISGDGKFVYFMGQPYAGTGGTKMFQYKVADKNVRYVPHGDGAERLSVSRNGAQIVFENLTFEPGDTVGDSAIWDLFMLRNGALTTISTAPNGQLVSGNSRWPTITKGGHYVTFHSDADDYILNDHNGGIDVFMKRVK